MSTEALHCQADLLDRESVAQEIAKINLTNIDDVILVHGVGKFKYESECEIAALGTTEAEVDDEIFSSNYHTFVNIAEPLTKKLSKKHQQGEQTTLALCAFGSITDKYKIPFWRSYTYAKDSLREYIKELAKSPEWGGLIRGRFVNVSTTDTGNENKLRPYATAEEKKYWLKPETVVERAIAELRTWEHEIAVISTIRASLPQLMWHSAGISRSQEILDKATSQVSFWREKLANLDISRYLQDLEPNKTIQFQSPNAQKQLKLATETLNLVDISYLILKSAAWRTESRGGHYRQDYPQLLSSWQVHTLIQRDRIFSSQKFTLNSVECMINIT